MPASNLSVGMKIYDNDWHLRHGLEPQAAADLLADMGVTWVIAQSRYLPMADSAVESAVRQQDLTRYATLDDVAFRERLRERGIAYFAVLNICFDPGYAAAHPDLLPIDQFGRREEMQDWYIGLPPDRKDNIGQKAAMLTEATRALKPDGIHLGFIRWPGFWETWLSDVDRARMPDYCYSRPTLTRFASENGLDIPVDDPLAAARLIAERHRAQWRDWKCGVTAEAIAAIRKDIARVDPAVRISINTVPLFKTDFDNAVEEVFGQDVARLREVVDVFEVMAYHQIMRQPAGWPAAVAADIRARSGQTTVCTLQARPLYLDGMHAGRGRSATLSPEEFALAVNGVEKSDIDGLCVFTFTDFLELRHTAAGQKMIERLRRFRR